METKSIYSKLLEFQKLGLSVKKDGKNPHFKSSFPTLNSVLDTVTEPLNALGLVIIFSPEETGLRTSIVDADSGDKIESFMKYVGVTDAQKLLACNTYFRRGSLVALLGLSDEDDDGETTVKPNVKPQPIKKQTAFEIASQTVLQATTEAEVKDLGKRFEASTKLTDDEKRDLRTMVSHQLQELTLPTIE